MSNPTRAVPTLLEELPCNVCRGLCCGPVPVLARELKQIKKYIRSIPRAVRESLQNQPRHFGTCIFYDQENNKCGVECVKPSICRAFGHYANLICFRKPWAAQSEDWVVTDLPAGVLSVDYTWPYFR